MKRRTFPRAFYATLAVSFLLALAFLVSTPASGQRPLPVRQDLERELDNFDQLTLDPAAVLRNVRKSGGLTLNTSRGEFEMSLEPFDVRSDDYRAVAVGEGGVVTELPRTPSHSFKGTVRGMDDTQVRFVLDGQQVEGIIVTPAETFYVEPTSHLSKAASANDFVFYAGSSVKKTTEGECATTLAQQVGSATTQFHNDAVQSSKGIGVGAAFAPEPVARLATEADFEFFQADSNSVDATNGDIANLITQVDAIYEQQLGVKLNLVFQRVWTTSNDPYTLTAANNALDEFQQKYNASFHAPDSPPSRDLVQMFTGKDLDGSTIGIAYISAVCFAPDFAFSIVQSKFTTVPSLAAERVGLSAHEMGHNFGASHPDEESPVPPSCSPSIMNSSIQNTTNFCQFSRDQMTTLVAGSSCLSRQPQFNCPLTSFSLSTASQYFPSNGGVGSIGVNAPAGCSWDVAEGASWLTVTGGAPGAGPGTPAYTVAANTGAPREAIVDVAGQKLTVLQAASNACASQQINVGQSVSGSLDTGDCLSGQPDRPNTLADLYTFTGRAGQHVKIELTASASLDTFLYLFGPDGTIVAFNDDIDTAHGVTNSRIPDPNTTTDAFFTLPKSGVYTIEATSFDTTSPNNTGGYTLALSADTASSSVSLPVNAFTVNEGVGANGLGTDGTGFRVINVTRTGDTSGTATVDYATTNGTADKHGDYEQTLGTLVFAPGVTTQSFTVFVTDDRFAEQPETVNVTLSNPVGTSLGLTPTATLTINNNPRDAVNNPSPVRWDANFDTGFFVRQQYLDFLSREPDASGFQFWSNDLNNSCGADVGCAQAHRVNVSAAFFLSIEFQETGYLVERMYKTAFGDASGNSTFPNAHTLPVPVVRLEQFLPDTQRIGQNVVVGVGDWQTQLENNKNTFALEFVMRPAFISAYPLSLTPAQFVDKLNANAGGVLTQAQRDQFVAQLNASPDVAGARASVLRAVAENPVLKTNEFDRAFVLMQFFGYLRRNPNDAPDSDYTGYDFWLTKLDQFNGNFTNAEMVKAFISSTEYTNRFGT